MTNQNYDFINTDNAAIILQTICKENTEIKQRAKKLAIQLLSNVNIEDVADEVYSELSCIAVEDLWDRSGSDSYGGYTSPEDMAVVMFEETIEPFIKKLEEYQKNSLLNDRKLYCMGILQG